MFLVLCCGCLCPIHSRQVLSREWRCSWMLQLHLSDQQFYCPLMCVFLLQVWWSSLIWDFCKEIQPYNIPFGIYISLFTAAMFDSPTNYLTQCPLNVYLTHNIILQWLFSQNTSIFIHKNKFKMASAKRHPFSSTSMCWSELWILPLFRRRKNLRYDSNFTEVCYWGCRWQ